MCILLWMQIRIVRASTFHLWLVRLVSWHKTVRHRCIETRLFSPDISVSSHRKCWQDGLRFALTVSSTVTVLIDQTWVIMCLPETLLKSLRVDQVELRLPQFFLPHSHKYNNDSITWHRGRRSHEIAPRMRRFIARVVRVQAASTFYVSAIYLQFYRWKALLT
jgi:hypothetical protein